VTALRPQPWLLPLSWAYGLAVQARNCGFDAGLLRVRRLPVPVISIGNLGAGGTGKTPLVIWLVAELRARGLRPGVLARGYGRAPGETLNDEGRLLARRYPDLPQEQDADRFATGLRILQRQTLDVLVLDDGFQHRRLFRDRDVCLLDAADPGGGGLLPSGWRREPLAALRRASVCVLTGAEGVTAGQLAAARELVRSQAPSAACLTARVEPVDLVEEPGGTTHAPGELSGRACRLVAAIARPERFRRTVEALGARVLGCDFRRDHTAIPDQQLAVHAAQAERDGGWLLWTEKDEARRASAAPGPRRFVLRIGLRFEDPVDLSLFLPPTLAGPRR
jgi:tetraacyldisaccharide 4'-kinase